MVMTESGKSGTALLWSPSGNRPGWIAIGSGSGAVLASNTTLVYDLNDRKVFDSEDISVVKEVNWATTWGANVMSGVPLREFGVTTGSSGGTVWNREGFGAIQFDGSNELQVSVTFQTF